LLFMTKSERIGGRASATLQIRADLVRRATHRIHRFAKFLLAYAKRLRPVAHFIIFAEADPVAVGRTDIPLFVACHCPSPCRCNAPRIRKLRARTYGPAEQKPPMGGLRSMTLDTPPAQDCPA